MAVASSTTARRIVINGPAAGIVIARMYATVRYLAPPLGVRASGVGGPRPSAVFGVWQSRGLGLREFRRPEISASGSLGFRRFLFLLSTGPPRHHAGGTMERGALRPPPLCARRRRCG